MSKTSSTVKDRWNLKNYDNVTIRFPKGRKATVEAFAREHDESINGMVNRLVMAELGLSEAEWKKAEATAENAEASATMKSPDE